LQQAAPAVIRFVFLRGRGWGGWRAAAPHCAQTRNTAPGREGRGSTSAGNNIGLPESAGPQLQGRADRAPRD
jgi:hypothetical protein